MVSPSSNPQPQSLITSPPLSAGAAVTYPFPSNTEIASQVPSGTGGTSSDEELPLDPESDGGAQERASVLATQAAKPISTPGHWDFFISHTQRNDSAKLLATELFYSLRGEGCSAWLDVKMGSMSEVAMEEGVRNSTCMIAIISDRPAEESHYFRRDFCLQELRWAVESNVQIQPVSLLEPH